MTITKILNRDSYIRLIVEDADVKITFNISLDDYFQNKYKLNQEIDEETYQNLCHQHLYFYSINKCLRKLSYMDYSEKEIRDFLSKIDDLQPNDIDAIIDELKRGNFLNDETLIDTQLYVDEIKMVGKRKTRYKLLKKGVDRDLVDQHLETIDLTKQFEMALAKAKLYNNSIKEKSFKEKQFAIRNKLINDGFEDIDEVMASLNLVFDEDEERDNLQKAYEKAVKKYAKLKKTKKYSQQIFKYLYSQGYNSDMIRTILNEMENENED